MILRVCYDTEGRGWSASRSIFVVQRHMQALGSLAERYADAILTVQGVFVGKLGRDAYLPVFAPGSDLPVGADLAGRRRTMR